MRRWLAGATLLTIAAAPADLVVIGARIHTVDAVRPAATALAVRDGIIVYVGDDAGALALRGAATRVEAMDGRRMLPGLVDAHVHPLGIVTTGGCDLDNQAKSLAELRVVVAGCVASQGLKPGQWLHVEQWNFTNGNGPDRINQTLREALDGAAPDNPVQLLGYDGHHGGFNSAALRLAVFEGRRIGLSAATLKGPFRKYAQLVGVGADGEPTGGVNEDARSIMGLDSLTVGNRDAVMKAPERVMQRFAQSGITAFLDAAATEADLVFYDTLLARGGITAWATLAQFREPEDAQRADGSVDYAALTARATAMRAHFAGTDLVRADAIKLFADGVLEGDPLVTPATLPNSPSLRPYLLPRYGKGADGRLTLTGYGDGTGGSGKLQHREDIIMDYVAAMRVAGFQMHIHAIGDRAIRVAVNAIEASRAADEGGPPAGRADTLAHLQLVAPEEVPRIGRAGLFLAFTYAWAYTDPEYDLSVIPFVDRVRDGSFAALHDPANYYERNAYPVKRLAAAGGVLVGGSDAPVETRDPRPFVNIASAVLRARGGTPALSPGERIDVAAAVRAYTLDGARSLGREAVTGSISVGKSADFIVLDRDVMTVPPEQIGDTVVAGTWFRGKRVWPVAP